MPRLGGWALWIVMAIAPAGTQETAGTSIWKVGLARVDITPERPVFMAGYDARDKPFESIEARIHAKALVLEDATGRRAALITADLSGFTPAVVEPVCAAIRERIGLERKQILLNASHNHSGPLQGLDPNPRRNLSAEDARNTASYTQALQQKLIQVVVDAASKLEPARLSWGSGVAFFVMNRREFTPNGIILGVNPRGPVDRSLPVLRIEGLDGQLRAAVFGTACHNTTLTGNNYRISGDYAGYAQTYVEERYRGVQAMFMAGCGGDANPYPRGTVELAREHGTNLGKEICRVLETKLTSLRGPLTVEYELVDLPFKDPPSREELRKWLQDGPGWRAAVARALLETLDRGEQLPRHQRAPLAVWQFGEDLTLVAISGEVVVDYVPLLEKALGPLRLWISGYSNEVFGYLPSARVLEEGGYETRGASGRGIFSPAAQDVVVAKVRELALRAGRKGN
jgi:neutral ceramidase